MYKQSPSRNYRSKGFKVRNFLQICVLLAICFWLLYQVKHSHERRKEFESKDKKVLENLQSDNELQRFGRKDIPRVIDLTTNAENHEDVDERKFEEDRENKHEGGQIEQEGVREEEERDEHEPEKTEEEEENANKDIEREEKGNVENEESENVLNEGHLEEGEEEFGKEGHTESQESDGVDKEDHDERGIKSDDHDRDHDHDADSNTRKAQEELYQADDASSEVAQSVQSINQENENVTLGQESQTHEKINSVEESDVRTSENFTELVKPKIQPREDVNITSFDETITDQKDDISLENSTLPEIPYNSTVVDERIAFSLLSNQTQTNLDANLSENGTIGIEKVSNDKNGLETRESANISENVDTNKMLDNGAIKDSKESLVSDESEGTKSEDVGKGGSNENSKSISSESQKEFSDIAMVTKEERESRIDLDTLPEIKSEVHDTEDAVAE